MSAQNSKLKKVGRRILNPGRKIKVALSRLNVHPGRKLALYFLQEVEQMGGFATRPQPSPLPHEILSYYRMNFECLNCGKVATHGKLYCEELCRDFGGTVRYVRGRIADERIWELDIQEAIGTRLLMMYGGGYPTAKRRITKNIRTIVFERDGDNCVLCGAVADQIDHIAGSSAELENLRAICGRCNRNRAFAEARPATAEEVKFIEATNLDLAQRIAAPKVSKVCDHPDWSKLWGGVCGARQKQWNELQKNAHCNFQDVDGYLVHAMAKDD